MCNLDFKDSLKKDMGSWAQLWSQVCGLSANSIICTPLCFFYKEITVHNPCAFMKRELRYFLFPEFIFAKIFLELKTWF